VASLSPLQDARPVPAADGQHITGQGRPWLLDRRRHPPAL